MDFTPVGYFNVNTAAPVDLLERAPWLYVIVATRDRLMYVGETCQLVSRLSDHFGPYPGSTLRRAAARAGCREPRQPFVVVAARLPADDHGSAPFDGSSRKVRQLCEALLHSNLARHPGRWWIVSTPQAPSLSVTREIEESCLSISTCCITAIDFLGELTLLAPFSFVVLSGRQHRKWVDEAEADVGILLNQIEVRLHEWLMDELKSEYGERWWTGGVPKTTRLRCASRMEEEGSEDIPKNAYLTFIDLRDIIRGNWRLFGSAMEQMTKAKGKDRATQWLVELNEIRKLWAHPIKRRFRDVSLAQRARAHELWREFGKIADRVN